MDQDLKLMDTNAIEPFDATIEHRSGAKVYKTDKNELFAVVVLPMNEFQRVVKLTDELKENGKPTTFESALEKSVTDGITASLRSVEYTLNNNRRKEFIEKLEILDVLLHDEKITGAQYDERKKALKRQCHIGGTRVSLS